ncbi:MAG: amylo-alpha-1,6-glucosidase [Acidobacteriota bacterium]
MEAEVLNAIKPEPASEDELESLLTREWLVTNGLGGYASGTISGVSTRRYHGLLMAALPAPVGRILMLAQLSEEVRLPDGSLVQLWAEEPSEGELDLSAARYLTEFRLESGLPVWSYKFSNTVIEKRVLLAHLHNIVQVTYHLVSGPENVTIRLRPWMHFRPHEAPVSQTFGEPYLLKNLGNRYEVQARGDLPPLRLACLGEESACVLDGGRFRDIFYRLEERRGYDSSGVLWSPGYFRTRLSGSHDTTLIASTEDWNIILALEPEKALQAELQRRESLLKMAHPAVQSPPAAELIFAADQFIIWPYTRLADAARALASGTEARSIIAGYHWFTEWGRDTMISLEGLTLTTGRHREAGDILRTFSYYIRDGLIPNLFPEGKNEGLYHTADATLWLFHAVHRYLEVTGDCATFRFLLPKLVDIVDHHIRGTLFGIQVDPSDGLLRQGKEGYQLTWMDAQVDDWVVTPRRGKAVEINALWYNALRLMEGWIGEEQGNQAAEPLAEHADRAYESFNRRFWYEEGGYLYDIVDGEAGNDSSLRPNQIFAISLPHPVLDHSRWEPVIETVRRELLTPVGLRSLAPGYPDYKSRYFGDLRARDAAYHQGTVWGWLIGPFVDAWLKLHPQDRQGARRLLEGFLPHLKEACVGSISEIFDAEEPFHPRGCVAQAWSVAEALRCWVKTETRF